VEHRAGAPPPSLFNAYSNEFAELLAGRFHDDAGKSHAHNNTAFTLADAWAPGWVRFGPHPSSSDGGDHAARDLTNWFGQARQQIVFALNQLTHGTVATSLVQAANRGVQIDGVMPRSDTDPGETSAALYSYLTNAASYATTNRIRFWPAHTRPDGATNDTGQADLVHAKWAVVDPFGEQPGVIHGSANWTFSALQSGSFNDENIVFVRHRDIARLFYLHFKQITGAFTNARTSGSTCSRPPGACGWPRPAASTRWSQPRNRAAPGRTGWAASPASRAR
jgi:hypothetical protein